MLTDGAKNIKLLLTAGVGNDYAVAWGVSHASVGTATAYIVVDSGNKRFSFYCQDLRG